MAKNKLSQWAMLMEDIPTPLRNKFILVSVFFVIWMSFFDRNSIYSQYKLRSTFGELQAKQIYYRAEIKKAEKDRKELFTNDKTLEKFAREHFYMKKTDEVVFVIEKK
jgi:cell division protein DivIC